MQKEIAELIEVEKLLKENFPKTKIGEIICNGKFSITIEPENFAELIKLLKN